MSDPTTEAAEAEALHRLAIRRAKVVAASVLAIVVAAWCAFAATWIYYTWPNRSLTLNPQEAGQFGDTFGAINALFSGLALAGVVYALMIQHLELASAQRENKASGLDRTKTARLMKDQAAHLRSAAMLNAANALSDRAEGRSFYILAGESVQEVSAVETYRQYMKVVLFDVSRDGDEDPRSMFRRYFEALLQDAHSKISRQATAQASPLDGQICFLHDEARHLLGQDGVWGTADSTLFTDAWQKLAELRDDMRSAPSVADRRDRACGVLGTLLEKSINDP